MAVKAKKANIRNVLLADVAEMYYFDNLNQAEIAAQIGVTRSMVSRMLTEAHEKGIIEVTVNRPITFDHELQEQLIDKFNLKEAYVFHSRELEAQVMYKRLGEACASIIQDYLRPNMILGLPWGHTVSEVIDALEVDQSTPIKAVQLIGALGTHHYEYDGHNLIRRIIEKLGGEGYYLNSPFLLDSPETVQVLLKNQDIQEVMEIIKRCDMALLGVGSMELEYSSYYQTGYIDAETCASLQKLGAVGYVCGLHFDVKGNPRCLDFESRVLSISREDLMKIPVRIGIAGGPGKVLPVTGAMSGAYINILVTDHVTATAIMNNC